jgi:hypothetical protein
MSGVRPGYGDHGSTEDARASRASRGPQVDSALGGWLIALATDALALLDELDRGQLPSSGSDSPPVEPGAKNRRRGSSWVEMSIWPPEPEDDPPITSVHILVDTLSPAERRDLANSMLRAAWCATLEQTRVLLLDALVEIDHNVFGGTA